MNQAHVFTECVQEGYIGKFKLVWGTKVHTVTMNGQTAYFKTEKDAKLAAWEAKHEKEYPVLRRDGETLSSRQSDANAVFSKGVFARGA